jgi:hypothetical protein
MKIRPVGAEFYADDEQAFTKQISFSQFCERAQKSIYKFKRKSTPVTTNVSHEFIENIMDSRQSFSDNFLLILF